MKTPGFEAMSAMFAACTKLTSLDFSMCQPGVGGMRCFASCLASTSLCSLEMGYSMMGDEGATALAPLLRANTCLTALDLYVPLATAVGFECIVDALIECHTSLTSLVLISERDSRECVGAVGRKLGGVLGRNKKLVSILAGELGIEATSCLAERSLERYVGFGSWPSEPEVLAPLARALSGASLRGLLDGGIYFEKDAKFRVCMQPLLAEARRQDVGLNADLKTLCLCHCSFDQDSVSDLVHFARVCSSITNLSLRGCGMDSASGSLLGATIHRSCETLRTIDLSWNRLRREWSQVVTPHGPSFQCACRPTFFLSCCFAVFLSVVCMYP